MTIVAPQKVDLEQMRQEIIAECERRTTQRIMVYLTVYETKTTDRGTLMRTIQANLPKAGTTGKFIQIRWNLWGKDTQIVGDYLKKYIHPRKKYTIEFDSADLISRQYTTQDGREGVEWKLQQPAAIFMDLVSIIKGSVTEKEAEVQSKPQPEEADQPPVNDDEEQTYDLDHAF